jgi:uncharacterized membrane protein
MDAIVEAIARSCCHGIDARSLCIDGRTLPFCARCTGTYIGVAIAIAALAVLGRLRDHRLPDRRRMGLLIVPWAASGGARLLEFAGWDIAGNPGRAALGFACGASGALIFAPLFARVLWPDDPGGRGATASVVIGAGVLLSPAALMSAAARYAYLALAPAAGFALVVIAINALLGVSLLGQQRRPLAAAWALIACACAAEIALAFSAHQWLDTKL